MGEGDDAIVTPLYGLTTRLPRVRPAVRRFTTYNLRFEPSWFERQALFFPKKSRAIACRAQGGGRLAEDACIPGRPRVPVGLAVTDENKDEREEKKIEASEAEGVAEDEDRDEGDEEQSEDNERSAKSGRSQVKIWIAVGVGVVIAVLLVLKPGTSTQSGPQLPAVGSTTTGDLTLVNADRNELECAAAKGVDNYQCGFADEKQARQVEERLKLRPFMTVNRQLYLIPGLFLEPAISQRYNSEPPNKPRGELKRFTAKCTIKVVGDLDGVKLRWDPKGNWEPAKKFSVATVSNCKIDG